MKLKSILIIGIAAVAVAVLAAFAFMGFVFLDGMSYTATGSQTLSPPGTVAGKALVVYDPGLSGKTRDVAALVAGDLRDRGYEVVLAGVRSRAASDAAGYDVIVTGGPVYAGNVSGSIASYLKALASAKDARVGAFTTGSDPDVRSDPAVLMREAAPLPPDCPTKVSAVMKVVPGDEAEPMCTAFVDTLLK